MASGFPSGSARLCLSSFAASDAAALSVVQPGQCPPPAGPFPKLGQLSVSLLLYLLGVI